MSNLLVSVIIPFYNCEKYIESCIKSVRNQIYQNIEIICVNDGSTDKSLDIVINMMRIDNRILLIDNKDNKGVSFARNCGLEAAQGKYVYFLDADDLITEDAISFLTERAESKSVDCVYFNSSLQEETKGVGSPILQFGLSEFSDCVMKGEELFAILKKNNRYTGSVWRQFWRKEYLISNNIFFGEGLLGEDALFSVIAMLLARKVVLCDSIHHIYRRRGDSMSTDVSVQKAISLIKIYCQLLLFWGERNFNQEVDEAFSIHMNSLYIHIYQLFYRNNFQITENDFCKGLEQHIFFILNQKIMEKKIYKEEKIQELKKYKKIVVYGAGNYAVSLIDWLERHNISIDCIAVTKIHDNTRSIGNIPLYEICDLLELKDDMVVVFGAAKKNREEMKKQVQSLGFNFIDLYI